MFTKEECLKTLNDLYMFSTNAKMYYANRDYHFYILRKLIEEHFDNSMDFKHFKLHSDGTLKTFKKDELIDYIHMLYKNWQGTDSVWENAVKMNYKLQSEIDELKSNPPLKFEELKVGMFVWDNKMKDYYKIYEINQENKNLNLTGWHIGNHRFEENRYYRKQVLYE